VKAGAIQPDAIIIAGQTPSVDHIPGVLEQTTETFTYTVNKMTFIVTPKYREDGQKNIGEILLEMMLKDTVDRCNA
jgi:hypothetical protein